MSAKITEKAIGLRVTPELYDKISALCNDLDGMPINTFALRSVEASIDMMLAEKPKLPKWIAVSRFAMSYKPEESLGG